MLARRSTSRPCRLKLPSERAAAQSVRRQQLTRRCASSPRAARGCSTAATPNRRSPAAGPTAAVAAAAAAAACLGYWEVSHRRRENAAAHQYHIGETQQQDAARSVAFVGRERELDALRGMTEMSLPFVPHRRVCMLRGQQRGVGRSRLLREHAARATAAHPSRVVALCAGWSGGVDCPSGVVRWVADSIALAVPEEHPAHTLVGANVARAEVFSQLTTQIKLIVDSQGMEVPLPLLMFDGCPDDACAGGTSADLLHWCDSLAEQGLACVVVAPIAAGCEGGDTVPFFKTPDQMERVTRSDGAVLPQRRLLWLSQLSVDEASELALSIASSVDDDERQEDTTVAVDASAYQAGQVVSAEQRSRALALAAASGNPAEMGALLAKRRPEAVDTAIEERESAVLALLGVGGEGWRERACSWLLSADCGGQRGGEEVSACVCGWRVLCALAGADAAGINSTEVGVGGWLSQGSGEGAAAGSMEQRVMSGRSGALEWAELCAGLLGTLGVEAVVRQERGLPAVADPVQTVAATEARAKQLLACSGLLELHAPPPPPSSADGDCDSSSAFVQPLDPRLVGGDDGRDPGGLSAPEPSRGLPPEVVSPRNSYGCGWYVSVGPVSQLAIRRLARGLLRARQDMEFGEDPAEQHDDATTGSSGARAEALELLAAMVVGQELEVQTWHALIDSHALEQEQARVETARAALRRAVAAQKAALGRAGPPWGLGVAAAAADADAATQRVHIDASELESRKRRLSEQQAQARKREGALLARLRGH